jgi:hypothetical protein
MHSTPWLPCVLAVPRDCLRQSPPKRQVRAARLCVGATRLLLNPVTRYTEHVEALVEVAGLA